MQVKHAAFLVLACGMVAASATAAERASDTSWGKPGVTIDQYRLDAAHCAIQALDLDISNTRAARRLVAATRALQNVESAWTLRGMSPGNAAFNHSQVREAFQPRRQFEAIGRLQQSTLDACLVERGYRQFRLTDAQRRELGGLEEGSAERRAFLHRLAADPEVLRRQGLEAPALMPPQG